MIFTTNHCTATENSISFLAADAHAQHLAAAQPPTAEPDLLPGDEVGISVMARTLFTASIFVATALKLNLLRVRCDFGRLSVQ